MTSVEQNTTGGSKRPGLRRQNNSSQETRGMDTEYGERRLEQEVTCKITCLLSENRIQAMTNSVA